MKKQAGFVKFLAFFLKNSQLNLALRDFFLILLLIYYFLSCIQNVFDNIE